MRNNFISTLLHIRRHPSQIILFQRMETCLQSFLKITAAHFEHVQCRRNNAEIISELFQAAEIMLFQFQTWLHVKQNTEMISKLFRNNFISHVTAV